MVAPTRGVHYLWIVQNDRLHRVLPGTGEWHVVGGADWRGPASIAAADGALYIINNDRLHRVEPDSGAWQVLGGPDWGGKAFLVKASRGLFAVQNGYFHRVEYDGSWQVLGDWVWQRTLAMTTTPTSIYAIRDKENGFPEGSLWRIRPSGAPERHLELRNFVGTSAMTSIGELLYFVRKDTLIRVNLDAPRAPDRFKVIGTAGDWAGTQAMCSLAGKLFIVENDRLHSVDPTSGAWTVLGDPAWPGSAAMTILGVPQRSSIDSIPRPSGGLPQRDRRVRAERRSGTDKAKPVRTRRNTR